PSVLLGPVAGRSVPGLAAGHESERERQRSERWARAVRVKHHAPHLITSAARLSSPKTLGLPRRPRSRHPRAPMPGRSLLLFALSSLAIGCGGDGAPLPAAACDASEAQHGEGTYYDATGAGACSFD